MPERLQLSRRRGYRKPEGAVVVSRPSKWGNPFTVAWHRAVEAELGAPPKPEAEVRAGLVTAFRSVVLHLSDSGFWGMVDHQAVLAIREGLERGELTGKNLACWCPLDQPCHADVLLAIANPEEGNQP